MVHRWRCRQCGFTVWSASRTAITDSIKSHISDHHRKQFTEGDFQAQWECPYCERAGQSHDKRDSLQRFRDHLFEHVKPLMESGVHVGEEIGGTGSVLVRAPLNSPGADNARVHFLSPGDIALFVTTTPKRRIRLITEKLSEWPAWTIVVTTKENPLAGIDSVDLSTAPLEVVRLDRRLGLQDLGETVSRVVEEQDTTNSKLSVEFDILSEIIAKFDVQTVFKFLHVLTNRLESTGALSHFYVDPQKQSASTVNVLDQLFDVSLTADGKTFLVNENAAARR